MLKRAARPLRGEVTDVELHAEYDEFGVAAGLRRHLTTRPASLVSLGTRRQRGLSRLVFGSLAAEVIRASPSPVLVVPLSGALRR
jgi:nucleotide-binding universal stress UspA family protein